MVFEKISNVFRSAVNAPGSSESSIEQPHALESRATPSEVNPDEFAAAINMSIALSGVTSEFYGDRPPGTAPEDTDLRRRRRRASPPSPRNGLNNSPSRFAVRM